MLFKTANNVHLRLVNSNLLLVASRVVQNWLTDAELLMADAIVSGAYCAKLLSVS